MKYSKLLFAVHNSVLNSSVINILCVSIFNHPIKYAICITITHLYYNLLFTLQKHIQHLNISNMGLYMYIVYILNTNLGKLRPGKIHAKILNL